MPRCWDARERDMPARPNPGRRGSTFVSYSRAPYVVEHIAQLALDYPRHVRALDIGLARARPRAC